jgi:thiamine pyrophosphokinase
MYLINNGAQGVLKGINGCTLRLIKNGSILFKAGEYENGRRISVFSYGNEACGVTETGLKYSISDVDLKNDFPIGVSNEFTYEDAYISVKNGILMIYVGQLGG